MLELISQEWKVAIYAEKLLDKLMLRDKIFLSANKNYLLIGKCQTIPPEIYNSELVGNHLLLKVKAECN